MTEEDSSELHVRIGQVKIGHPGQTLTAILGSCIGIGFFLSTRQIYGLAHCLLPQSGAPHVKTGKGRHVDQAVETLLDMMAIQPDEKRKLRVVLAGGANMTMPSDTPETQLVGSLNAKSAHHTIRRAGLRLLNGDLGGTNGRRISINCETGDYEILSIPRMGGAAL